MSTRDVVRLMIRPQQLESAEASHVKWRPRAEPTRDGDGRGSAASTPSEAAAYTALARISTRESQIKQTRG